MTFEEKILKEFEDFYWDTVNCYGMKIELEKYSKFILSILSRQREKLEKDKPQCLCDNPEDGHAINCDFYQEFPYSISEWQNLGIKRGYMAFVKHRLLDEILSCYKEIESITFNRGERPWCIECLKRIKKQVRVNLKKKGFQIK